MKYIPFILLVSFVLVCCSQAPDKILIPVPVKITCFNAKGDVTYAHPKFTGNISFVRTGKEPIQTTKCLLEMLDE